jgi:hypothetical protein
MKYFSRRWIGLGALSILALIGIVLGATVLKVPNCEQLVAKYRFEDIVAVNRETLLELARCANTDLEDDYLSLLTDAELQIYKPKQYGPYKKRIHTETLFPDKVLPPIEERDRYLLPNRHPIEIDLTLSPPNLSVHKYTNELRPRIRMSTPKALPMGKRTNYYFEFDTDASFKSPNLVRLPNLLPARFDDDLTSRQGLPIFVMASPLRDVDSTRNEIEFPFRVSALRLPNSWEKLDYEELKKQAAALGYGLNGDALIEELFSYMRHLYYWGNDSKFRYPLDVFRTGIGECASVNHLLGTFLELNGIRYRAIAGFNPLIRQIYPGGGHTAIEVLSPNTNKWSYIDSYLDIYLPGVSGKELINSQLAKKVLVYLISSKYDQTIYGEALYLSDLFLYRQYNDPFGRMAPLTMLQLRGDESLYGLKWDLETVTDYSIEELFPLEIKVFVRGRYIITDGQTVEHASSMKSVSRYYRASPWAYGSFVVRPREQFIREK